MAKRENQRETEIGNRLRDELDTVRKLSLMAAVGLIGMKLIFTGGVTFRLGQSGRDIELHASVVAIAGALSILAAAFITAEHFARENPDVSAGHFLRKRHYLLCAWTVVGFVFFFTMAGFVSAA